MPFYTPLLTTLIAIASIAYITFHFRELKDAEADPKYFEMLRELRERVTLQFLVSVILFGPIIGAVAGFWIAYIISLFF